MEEHLYNVFYALANQNRREIIELLLDGDKSAVDFAAALDITTMGVIKHIEILERAKLVSRRKVGRVNWCHLNRDALLQLKDWPDLLEVSWLDMLTLEGK